MRHTVLVLIREPILPDKSEMGVGGWGVMVEEDREDGKRELARNREKASGVLI